MNKIFKNIFKDKKEKSKKQKLKEKKKKQYEKKLKSKLKDKKSNKLFKKKNKKEIITYTTKETIISIIISIILTCIIVLALLELVMKLIFGIGYIEMFTDSKLSEFLNVYSKVLDGYYEDVDKSEAIDSAIDGIVEYLGDKYTVHMDEDETNELEDSLSGTYQGVGISLSSEEDGVIYEVIDGSSAEEAGLQKGDKIISINGTDVTEKTNDEIASMIKESSETKFTIEVERDKEKLSFELEKKETLSPSISNKIIEQNDKKIGYIYISSFTKNLESQVSKKLKSMEDEGITGLIIDVRQDSGGYLSAAEETLSLFLKKDQVIYSLEDKDNYNTIKDKTGECREYPIVVLIDGGTASASEILASALKDSYGATLVGTTSYGKGKVQKTVTLSDGTAVKYTSSKWLRPNGDCIDQVGITPDYEVELEYEVDKKGYVTGLKDTQLEKAIELLTN